MTDDGQRADDPLSPETKPAPTVESVGAALPVVVAQPVQSLPEGSLLGRYRIEGLVGSGGMGEVYAASDLDLDRRVAIKVVRPRLRDPEHAHRLLREAKAMARLTHQNVMTVYEVGRERGVDYVVMEFVEGQNLREWSAGEPSVEEIVAVFRAAGSGLAAAHAAGLIHRDIKPSNILRASDGRVIVMDFGIARLGPDPTSLVQTMDSDEAGVGSPEEVQLTQGFFVGTPAFAAPEQFKGDVSADSDQYSFCASLYAVLFGRPPHGADPASVREALRKRVVIEPGARHIPRWLWRVISRGLARKPDDRYDSMTEVVAALGHGDRRRRVTTGAAAAVAVGLVGVAAQTQFGGDSPCEPASALDEWERQREQVRAAPWAIEPDASGPRYAPFGESLDAYADRWAESWREACEATHVRDVQSEEVLDGRMACLNHRRERVRVLLRALSKPTHETLVWASGAVHTLPEIERCNHVATEESQLAPQPDVAEEARGLQLRLAAAEAALPTVPLERALSDAATLVQDATKLGHRPLVAEALAVHGATLALAEHFSKAQAAYEEAVAVADEVGHHRILARALVALVGIDSALGLAGPAAERRQRRARLTVERHGYDDLTVALEENLAGAAALTGDWSKAETLARRAVATRRAEPTPNPVAAARAEFLLGVVLESRGQAEEAIETLQSAVARLMDTFGEDTHDSVRVRGALASALRSQARWDDAHLHTRAIAEFLQTVRGEGMVFAVYEPWRERLRADRDAGTSFVVKDASGSRVEGAEVVVARTIRGDGAFTLGDDLAWWVSSGADYGKSGADGTVALRHARSPVWVVAEHERGRSWPTQVAGARSEPVQLELRPWAELEGIVRVDSGPSHETTLHLFPADLDSGRDVSLVVEARSTGEFRYERIASGSYIVGVQVFWEDETQLIHRFDRDIRPDAGNDERLMVDVLPHVVRVEFPATRPGAPMEFKVFAASGTIAADSVATLDPALVSAAASGPMAIGTTDGGVVQLRGLPLGSYSFCVRPLAEPSGSPQARLRDLLHEENAAVECLPVQIKEAEAVVRIERRDDYFGVAEAP